MDTSKLVDDLTTRVRETFSEAEARAREIVADAEERARGLVADAQADAKQIRERAEAEAEQRLARMREALANLEGALTAAPSSEVEPGPVTVPEPTPPAVPEPTPPVEPPPSPPAEPEPLPPEPEIQPPPPAQPDRSPPQVQGRNGAGTGERSKDAMAARIVATKMALDHASRDEIAAHLAENYDLANAEKMLDDILTRTGT